MVLSEEDFLRMRAEMDKDGDGTVSKEEFKPVWMKTFGNTTPEEFEELWKNIDADGDGNLTAEELAKHFGFTWGDKSSNEMTDEQILAALAMAASIEDEAPKKKEEVKEAVPVRDPTIEIFYSDIAKNKDQDKVKQMIRLDEAILLQDFLPKKDDPSAGDDCETLLKDDKMNLRYADDKGETVLHKLARSKVPDAKKLDYKTTIKTIVEKMKAQCDKESKHMSAMVNYQDKKGKTPLFLAIEHTNITMIDQLFALKKVDQPDVLMSNANGWTMLHAAAQANNLDLIKKVVSYAPGERKKVLFNATDKDGRTPLHIAAFKDDSSESEIVKWMCENGAKDAKTDTGGNKASALANKSGRRKSKEIIDSYNEAPPEAGKQRRRSRDSKELLAPAEAPAAAPAAA